MQGYWITIDGLDGVGKTTQVQMLYKWLIENNIPVVRTTEPGGTEMGQTFRKLLKSEQKPKMELITELLLFEADRHETMKKVIQPNLINGKFIISDRGMDSTMAYQGFGRGIDLNLINHLTTLSSEGCKPDLTILIDMDPNETKKRIDKRINTEEDQYDYQTIEFRQKVRQGYLYMSRKEPWRVKVVNGKMLVNELHYAILNIFREFLRQKDRFNKDLQSSVRESKNSIENQ